MTKEIMIIDYGMGNIGSVECALHYLKGEYFVSNKRESLRVADAFILPGVGAFPSAMENLQKLHLIDELEEQILKNKKPFLGICLGMQLLAKSSVEQRYQEGLGWIDAEVVTLEATEDIRVPHVGWNNISFDNQCGFFDRIDRDAHFYFDHSFHLKCAEDLVVAQCNYGGKIVAAIRKGNIFATQFHPEKSQRNGLKLLRNFLNFVQFS